MLQNFLGLLDNGSKNFLNTLKRFPLVSFSAFILTLILTVIFITSRDSLDRNSLNYLIANKIAFIATLAMPLFLLLRLISNSRLLTLLGIFILGVYYYFLPLSFGEEPLIIQRHALLILAIIVLIFPAPFLFRSIKNAKFWEWTQQILFASLHALIFSFILYLSLKGLIYLTEELFHFKLQYNISEQLTFTIFGIFGVNYFLSQIPRYPLLVPIRPYNKFENIFTKYILTPLTLIYFFILSIYEFKLLFFSELSSGTFSWLILTFSALSILTLLFWTPLWSERSRKYKKWVWIAIFLQTLLLGWSIYLRIEEYGVTENRYFIALIGVWLFALSLYFLLYKKALYKWFFISLSLTILFSQLSPYSANNIAKKSQLSRLSQLLTQYPNLSNETNLTIRYQISDSINYLNREHGLDSLMPIFPQMVSEFKLQSSELSNCETAKFASFAEYATNKLGFNYVDKWQWKKQLSKNNSNKNLYITLQERERESIDVKGYEWMQTFKYSNYGSKSFCPPQNKIVKQQNPFTIETTNREIILKKEFKVLATINIENILQKIKIEIEDKNTTIINNPYGEYKLDSETLTKKYQNSKVDIKILFQRIYFKENNLLTYYLGHLLIHEK